jgi:Leucine-rich repeat (LRR) protein
LELDYNASVTEYGFKHLTALQKLVVSDACEMSMDDISMRLTNLTKLDLSEPEDLYNDYLKRLTKLKTLNLACCHNFDWNDCELQTLSHLEELSIDNHIDDPIYIPSLKKLEIIVANHDLLRGDYSFNASIVLRHLTNLEELSLYDNASVKLNFTHEIFVKLAKLNQITIRKPCYEEMKRLTSSYPMIIVKTFDNDDDSEEYGE